ALPQAARTAERDTALDALATAAHALEEVAASLPDNDAEIVRTGALMALDPALRNGVETAVMREGLAATAAIIKATAEHADAIAALGDETLAARADDVRSLGRRAAALLDGAGSAEPPGAD